MTDHTEDTDRTEDTDAGSETDPDEPTDTNAESASPTEPTGEITTGDPVTLDIKRRQLLKAGSITAATVTSSITLAGCTLPGDPDPDPDPGEVTLTTGGSQWHPDTHTMTVAGEVESLGDHDELHVQYLIRKTSSSTHDA